MSNAAAQDMIPPSGGREKTKNMPKRDKKTGRFLPNPGSKGKGKGKKVAAKKTTNSTTVVYRNMPARNAKGQFASASNPGLPSNWIIDYGGAAAVSTGIQVATNAFLAPMIPKFAPFIAPLAEGAIAYFALQKAKSRAFGGGMLSLALRDGLTAILGYIQARTAQPAPVPEGALWWDANRPFPQPAMSSPLASGTQVQSDPGGVAERYQRRAAGRSPQRSFSANRQTL